MRAGQAFLFAIVAVDVEPVDAVHALEGLEAIERHLARACDKLQQLGKFLLVERAESAPEPLYLR